MSMVIRIPLFHAEFETALVQSKLIRDAPRCSGHYYWPVCQFCAVIFGIMSAVWQQVVRSTI